MQCKGSGQSLGEFEMKWRHWQEECRRRLDSGEYTADNNMFTICNVCNRFKFQNWKFTVYHAVPSSQYHHKSKSLSFTATD